MHCGGYLPRDQSRSIRLEPSPGEIHPLFTQYNEDLGNRLNAGLPSDDFGTYGKTVAMFSFASNTPIRLGIGKESVTLKSTKVFPYVSPVSKGAAEMMPAGTDKVPVGPA
jgi:hypothetical protein